MAMNYDDSYRSYQEERLRQAQQYAKEMQLSHLGNGALLGGLLNTNTPTPKPKTESNNDELLLLLEE